MKKIFNQFCERDSIFSLTWMLVQELGNVVDFTVHNNPAIFSSIVSSDFGQRIDFAHFG